MTFAGAKFSRLLPATTFAMAAEFLMGLSDSVIAGHILGEDALSSVGLMQPVFNVVSFIAMLVGVGSSVLYSTEMGRFDKRRASELFTQGLWSALLFGGVVAALMFAFREPVLASFGASAEVYKGACDFWLWFLPCAVLEPVAFFLGQMCYNDGDDRLCTVSYAAQLFGNCALSVPLTFKYGLAGCAVGTVIGNCLAIAVLSCHFKRKSSTWTLARHFSMADSWRICQCSVGDACMRLCYAALFCLLNYYVISRFGSGKLPVLSVAVAVIGLSEAFDGVATAAQPLATVYIGEGNGRLVRRIMSYASIAAAAEGAALMLVLLAFPSLAVKLVGISDPALAAEAESAVRLVSVGLVGTSLIMLYNSYYMFVSERGYAVALTVLGTLLSQCALLLPLGAAFGVNGVWLALGLAPYAAIAAIALAIVRLRGPGKLPLLLDRTCERDTRIYDLVLDEAAICGLSEKLLRRLAPRRGIGPALAAKAALLVEETLMVVKERNPGRRILAEVSLKAENGIGLVMRDDGEIFDITDADAKIESLRSYLVSNLMEATPSRRNMTTTGFNRNQFFLRAGPSIA